MKNFFDIFRSSDKKDTVTTQPDDTQDNNKTYDSNTNTTPNDDKTDTAPIDTDDAQSIQTTVSSDSDKNATSTDDSKNDTNAVTDDIQDIKDKDDAVPATDKDTIPETIEDIEPTIDVNVPDIRLKTSIENESGYVVGFSIQGRSHIVSGIGCQDYHAYETIAPGWNLAITSDGAGSAREAERGSKANCELAIRLVRQLIESKKWAENNYFPTELEWYIEIRNIFELIQAIIQSSATKQAQSYAENKKNELAEAEEQLKKATNDKQKSRLYNRINNLKSDLEKPLEARDFNATLILMLITPQGMLTAHIGDGRMGYLDNDNNWKALMTPHKGEEASATVFIPNNWNAQREVPTFTMSGAYLPEVKVVKEKPKAFVLMSDGCESITWRFYAQDKQTGRYYDPNEPFAGFFNPLLAEMNDATDKEARVDRMIEIINIGTTAGRQEQDDRTMIFGVLK